MRPAPPVEQATANPGEVRPAGPAMTFTVPGEWDVAYVEVHDGRTTFHLERRR
jgi:hypothetical protein